MLSLADVIAGRCYRWLMLLLVDEVIKLIGDINRFTNHGQAAWFFSLSSQKAIAKLHRIGTHNKIVTILKNFRDKICFFIFQLLSIKKNKALIIAKT